MSIKKFFDQADNSRNYLTEQEKKSAFKEIESSKNLKQQRIKQDLLLPQVEYLDPANFAKFGSAYMYYKGALERIIDYYPYDGSDAEITAFYNKSMPIEKYIFNKMYPRTNGYVTLCANGWGVSDSIIDGYGAPATPEYITFFGGPNISTSLTTLKDMEPNELSSKFQYNNIYDTDIYQTEGYKSDYGKGTRESNLKSNFDNGVTVEFWIKTGSISHSSLTSKQVVFDMWNNEPTSSDAYGRITIELTGGAGSGNPVLITAQSGAASSSAQFCFTSSIGQSLSASSLSDWGHYAVTMYNSGTNFVADLHINGHLNDTNTYTGRALNELNSKNMVARLGALVASPSGSTAAAGSGKLSGSVDEFRFWKVARNRAEIGKNWFDQIRGGVNSDIANAELGMYYKFNEGITGQTALDSVILDYGGRLCNGVWTGYTVNSRNTGSAMMSASVALREYEDPIIYAEHPDIVSLKSSLLATGSYHDQQNAGLVRNLLPSWLTDDTTTTDQTDLDKLCHILGAYFDKLHLLTGQLSSLKHVSYTSASAEPLPFAQHLPQHLGLYAPEIFVDSTIIEKFKNRTDKEHFEGDLSEAKNLIYSNLYNNLTSIYKAKGTEKAIRNTLRCFNLDDTLVRYNVYSNNQQYELKNNLKQTLKRKTFANFNTAQGSTAVIYQAEDPHTSSRGFISGTNATGYEDRHGLTVETSVVFPRFFRSLDKFDRSFKNVSLFGMQTVNSGSTSDPAFLTSSQDTANFQVYAIRDAVYSKNAYFMLTSSTEPYNFPTLTSSLFFDVYDDSNWNFSVRVKPSNYPIVDLVSGSTGYKYDVIFRGTNNNLGTILNSFEVTSSITKTVGQEILQVPKRIYIGARNTNITGSSVYKTDVTFSSAKYWTKFVDNTTIDQHLYDAENYGISGSYRYVSELDENTKETLNFNSLALNWYFGNVTSSDSAGNFYVTDLSSGSADNRNKFGWMGNISSYLHSGHGYRFDTSNTNIVENKNVNEFKFIDPEQAVSSDMVQILDADDVSFGITEQIPNYVYTIEKSLYAAVTEEILDFFAGVIDFHHLIGQPVNRYRDRYKAMEHLRRVFFEKVQDTSTVEKFTEYYKWFDDAISIILSQLVPASADFVSDSFNTIESHVLERNKYKSQFPTIEFRKPDPEPVILGIGEKIISFEEISSPLPTSPRRTDIRQTYWRQRASSSAAEITSNNAIIDSQRQTFKEVIWSTPYFSGAAPTFSNLAGTKYHRSQRLASQRYATYILENKLMKDYVGGVNFEGAKNIGYTYNNLYPAGPVMNPAGGVYVPQNVLLAEIKDLVEIQELEIADRVTRKPNEKVKRVIKVQSGRNFEQGIGYTALKSTVAFPFNIMSSSVRSGYNKQVIDRVTASIEITNLHNDVYGRDMERPMQTTWSEYAAGGHQSRHVGLNKEAGTRAVGQIIFSSNASEGNTLTVAGVNFTFTSTGSPGDPGSTDIPLGASVSLQAVLAHSALNNYFATTAVGTPLVGVTRVISATTLTLTARPGKEGNFAMSAVGTPVAITQMAGGTGGVNGLDDYTIRPEAWKLLLGKCGEGPGDIGMVGADYPWPEANEEGESPYPMTASQKAVYYRDFVAKTPYVLKNIRMRTGSTILGNYRNNYEVVQAAGAWSNPRQFVEIGGQPNLPTGAFPNTAKFATQIRTFLDIHRGQGHGSAESTLGTGSHFQFVQDYSAGYLSGTENKTVIVSRFSNPGGLEVSPPGYGDVRSNEFSVYNATLYRNMTVLKPSQGPAGTISEITGVGGPGIRVGDIHALDYGLRSHLARHTARFGRDSLVLPPDDQRAAYNLAKPFIGYGDTKFYRSHETLQGWWRLNENVSSAGDVADSSGFGRNGTFDALGDRPTFSNALYPSRYIQTGSCVFDGSDDATNVLSAATWDAIIGNNTVAGSTEKMSFSAWIYKTGNGGFNVGRIIDFGETDIAVYTDSSNRIRFSARWSTGGVFWRSTNTVINDDIWTHIVVTYDATLNTNDPKIYVSGTEVGVTLSSGTKGGTYEGIATEACYLGNRDDASSGFAGNLADIAVWNSTLSDAEIQAIYNASKLPEKVGPGYANTQMPGFHKVHRNNLMRMKKTSHEATWTRVNYNTGAVNNHTLVWQNPSTQTNNDMKLYHSGAFSKGGSAATSLSWTLVMWFNKLLDNGNTRGLIALGADTTLSNKAALMWSVDGGNGHQELSMYHSTTYGRWRSSTELQDDNWYHIAVTFDGNSDTNNPIFYVDGVADTTTEESTPAGKMSLINSINSGRSIIGAANVGATGAQPFKNIAMAEVAIYDTVLTAAEITQIYNNASLLNLTSSVVAPEVDNLVTWLRMGDTIGVEGTAALHDLSGSNTALSSSYTTTALNGEAHTVYDVRGNNHFAFWNGVPNNNNPGSFPSASLATEVAGHPAHFTGGYGAVYGDPVLSETITYETSSIYDNFNVQHMIPRSDKQYAFYADTIHNPDNQFRYIGYMPTSGRMQGMYSSSYTNGVQPFFNFASASEIGSIIYGTYDSGKIAPGQAHREGQAERWAGYTATAGYPGFLPQPCNHLNINIYEPVSASSVTLGWPIGTPLNKSQLVSPTHGGYDPAGVAWPNNDISNQYRNWTMVSNSYGGARGARHFNMLMWKRNGQYGWTPFAQTHQSDHPVLLNQRKNNVMMMEYNTPGVLQEFPVRPVSLKGRPIRLNYDFQTVQTVQNQQIITNQNATLKTSYNNEFIYFNSRSLDNYLEIPETLKSEITPFEQLLALKEQEGFKLNWVHYTENVYPSLRNEFSPISSFRYGYDNLMWRRGLDSRIDLGSKTILSNSYGIGYRMSASSWPLDAPKAFLIRDRAPCILTYTNSAGTQEFDLSSLRSGGSINIATNSAGTMQALNNVAVASSGTAGELQNTYGWYHQTSSNEDENDVWAGHWSWPRKLKAALSPAGLYARKHTLASPLSINPPNYPNPSASVRDFGATGGIQPWITQDRGGTTTYEWHTASIGSGEAFWDAPTTAGYLTGTIVYRNNIPEKVLTFVSAASQPWYHDYDEYKENLRLVARGYSVVPEFRISDRIENYLKGDIDDFADFTIPGTSFNSTQPDFYKDFSNSDFMQKFLNIKDISNLNAKEFKLTCNAVVKFNPYKGFYPADRTLQLVSQFSRSYASTFSLTSEPSTGVYASGNMSFDGAPYRMALQPLFAPGILYNSIKSGIACDWPLVTDGNRINASAFTSSAMTGGVDEWRNGINYAWYPNVWHAADWWNSGSFWDLRLPFEAIINPAKAMAGVSLIDMEPHPLVSIGQYIDTTASMATAPSDNLYTLMASNFVAEVGDFFLPKGQYSSLKSEGVKTTADPMTFPTGAVYGSRLRMRASYSGSRTYEHESSSYGDNTWFTKLGAGGTYINACNPAQRFNGVTTGSFEIPQDPGKNPDFERDFVMYSRVSAFGPPFISWPDDKQIYANWYLYDTVHPGGWADATSSFDPWLEQQNREFAMAASSGAMDCINGYNWAYTPPYYHGEAWCDFVFRPTYGETYTLEKILTETDTRFYRCDPGPQTSSYEENTGIAITNPKGTTYSSLINDNTRLSMSGPSGHGGLAVTANNSPYASTNINKNAMHLSASLNLFGIENVYKKRFDKFGREIFSETELVGKRWVIQPKFETPMLNFARKSERPNVGAGTGSEGRTKTIPTVANGTILGYGADTAADGMWHQFGTRPGESSKGIFLEMTDIPDSWLQYHYSVVSESSIYNNYDPASVGPLGVSKLHQQMESFGDLMGFKENNSSVRLGELAEQRTIKEAVVAIPYISMPDLIVTPAAFFADPSAPPTPIGATWKRFINIPRARIDAAHHSEEGSEAGDSLDAAGPSIRRMVDKMYDYILPPKFDFLRNPLADPIVMYIFEFKYKLDKDDLSYIWQNLAPRKHKETHFQQDVVAHELFNTELLEESNLMENPNLRWMIFKVKQRSQKTYRDKVLEDYGTITMDPIVDEASISDYPLLYNWPYDYLSIVELVKMEAEVLYKDDSEEIDEDDTP